MVKNYRKPVATWGTGSEWPASKPGGAEVKFYVLDEDTRVADNPYKDRMEVWNSLLENEWNDYEPEKQKN